MDIQSMRVGAEVITKMADEAEDDEAASTDRHVHLRMQAIAMGLAAEICERLDTLIDLAQARDDVQ